MNDETLHESLELEEAIPSRLNTSYLKLQIPIVLPMPLNDLTSLIDSTERQLKGAFGNKMTNLVVRNAPGESMCFQFTLEIPKQRTRVRAPRNRSSTGRGPGRPRKDPAKSDDD